jgi:hypothetical protein
MTDAEIIAVFEHAKAKTVDVTQPNERKLATDGQVAADKPKT